MASRQWWLLIVALGLLPSAVFAQPICRPAEVVTRFGDWHAESIPIRQSAPVPKIVPKTNAGEAAVSMRLLIAAPQPGAQPWSLSIRDTAGHLVAQLEKSDFANSTSTVWTGRLAGPLATVALRGGDADTLIEIRGSTASGSPGSDQNAFSISGVDPTWRSLYPTPSLNLRNAGEAVGMFVGDRLAPSGDGPPGTRASWCCSGVMIGRNLYLTNWHCSGSGASWDGEVVGNAVIDLAWENGPVRRQFSVVGVVEKDERLDFAILRVKPAIGTDGAIRTTIPVEISTAAISNDQSIFMIHHAQCQPKLISDNCRIQNASRAAWTDPLGSTAEHTEITHNCDTEPGASGAPIFDVQGRLLALHHLGHQKETLAQCPADNLNKAVRISAIVAFVKSKNHALARELGW